MGLGDMFSDIFGGKNKYQASLPPFIGSPQKQQEKTKQYEQRVLNARKISLPHNVLNFKDSKNTLGDINDLAQQLILQGQGQGPNPALQQLNMTRDQNIASGAGMIGSARGVNPALALRLAGNQAANLNQQAAGQAALQSAEQQLASQQAAGSVLQNLAGLKQQQAIAQGQAGLGLLGQQTGRLGTEQQAMANYQNLVNNAYANMNNVNAGVASQNAGTAGAYGQGIMGGIAGGIGSMFHKGGEVPEMSDGGEVDSGSEYFLHQQQENAMKKKEDSGGGLMKLLPMLLALSKGGQLPEGDKKIGVVMKEYDKGKLKSSSGSKVTNPKQAIAIALSEQRKAEGHADGGFVDAIRRKHYADGGMAINDYLNNVFSSSMMEGGKVQGSAPVNGDSVKNDVVPALLSPGEVVIPRSKVKNPDAAHDFLDNVLSKKRKPSYGDVIRAQEVINRYKGGMC